MHDRAVALKVLRREYAGSVSSERFRREIEILSRLDHPNIVSLQDWGEFDGAPWYAMPYLGGETLRARIARDGQLPIAEALRITRSVAEALVHAHEADVVHRDIKPGNILLEGDSVLVADFGIARAITTSATSDQISSSGILIGTPTYMSPEQATAKRDIDGRSDIYALGCVLYEMLAGEPPFNASSPAALTARHLMDPVPPITTVRASVPEPLAQVVYQMLAKSPADRFQSARELDDALARVEREPNVSVVEDRRRTRRWRRASLATAAVVVLSAGGWSAWSASARAAEAELVAAADTTIVAVFPLTTRDSVSGIAGELSQSLAQWRGITVVTPDAADAASRASASEVRSIALHLGAARYIRTSTDSAGGEARIHGALFDVGNPLSPIAEASADVVPGARDEAIAALLDRLLLRPADSTWLGWGRTTTSLPARQAYLQGEAALQRWDLAAADSAFSASMRYDGRYAPPALKLALSRIWAGRDSAAWAYAARAALAGRPQLTPVDRDKVEAIGAQADGDRVLACARWDALTRQWPFDFEAWYGAGDCLTRDRIVIPDASSTSGFRFRTGAHSALLRYRKAFELRPAVLHALRNDQFEKLRRLLWTSGVDVRTGFASGTLRRRFLAVPSWENDTLAFVPFPEAQFASADPLTQRRLPTSAREALGHQRELFRDIATGWVASSRGSAESLEALALAMFLNADPFALDTLRSARKVAATPAEQQRVMSTEVWLRVQASLPADSMGIRSARLLADSLLASGSTGVDPHTLASIAALFGRVVMTERIEQSATRTPASSRRTLDQESRSLVVYSAFGGPADSLRSMEARVDSLLAAIVDTPRRAQQRMGALGRAAMVAFPSIALTAIGSVDTTGMTLLHAEAAMWRRDTATVRRILNTIHAMRVRANITEVSFDALFPEAWLLTALGDDAAAAAWLDPTLARLNTYAPLPDPIRAAAMVRALALRAEIAARAGDRGAAARWAGAVVALWSGADPFLQPLVSRMRVLAAGAR